MNPIRKIKDSIDNVAHKRCGSCPSYWQSCDHWGDWDEGCAIGRDLNEICLIALLPKFLSKPYSSYVINKQDKDYIKWYENEGKYDEFKDED